MRIPDGWTDTGERCGNGSPILTDGYSRRILGQSGNLLNIGNPGPHPGAGRPPERIRRDATESLEEHVGSMGIALGQVTARALVELEKGNVGNAAALLGQSSRIASTLASIGPGTKVTNVVEREGYHDAASRAYDQSHDKLSFLEALKRELDGIP